MHRARIRILIAAGVMTVIAVGFFSAIGIFAQDATPVSGGMTASAGTPGHALASSGLVVDLVDVAFDPRGFSIPANTPTVVTLVNKGDAVHNFTIDGLNIHSGDIQPGQSTTIAITAPAGAYAFYCSIPGHRAAGMVGTLTVT
jgi:uncharacterized cupredoxin-like copper-binding protein